MKNLVILFLLAVVSTSCQQRKSGDMLSRPVFDAHGQHVITSFGNRRQKTMSILYGNEAARQSALEGYRTQHNGASYTLVVYQQENDKYWYGAHINGAVKSIETITETPDNHLKYQLKQGAPAIDSLGHKITDVNRIAFIFSHQPSIFP